MAGRRGHRHTLHLLHTHTDPLHTGMNLDRACAPRSVRGPLMLSGGTPPPHFDPCSSSDQ